MSKQRSYRRGERSSAPPVQVPMTELRSHCAAVLAATGLPAEAADLVAESLVDADARGIGSHGVTRTRIYAERLRGRMIDPDAVPVVAKDGGATAHVDARNAIGHLGARTGLEEALRRARSAGVGAVGVGGSNHCGTLSFFTRRAAAEGMAVIAMSTAPTTMAYFGGRTRAVGTNPLSLAVPRGDGAPLVVDMATSATARGKIILANQLGQDIPDGWAVDADGRPTTDAASALLGSVLPFAGPKGSGLAMMIDLFSGALVGGATGSDIGDMYEDWTRSQRVSHLFLVLDPDAFLGRDAFLAQVTEFARRVHALPPAEGVETVLLPGELEDAAHERATRSGVTLTAQVAADLDEVATEVGLSRSLSVDETVPAP